MKAPDRSRRSPWKRRVQYEKTVRDADMNDLFTNKVKRITEVMI